jgi:hypothetical protein
MECRCGGNQEELASVESHLENFVEPRSPQAVPSTAFGCRRNPIRMTILFRDYMFLDHRT